MTDLPGRICPPVLETEKKRKKFEGSRQERVRLIDRNTSKKMKKTKEKKRQESKISKADKNELLE